MGDTMKKVKPGDPLSIPAATFNTFVDAARDYLQRRHGQGQQATPSGRHTCTIPVRNDSGSDRQRYEILGIDSPLFSPASDEEAFKNTPALRGVTPAEDDHAGKFVVLLEPVPAGELALAVAAGAVPVRIDVPEDEEDADYRFAEISDGEAGSLAASHDGSAAILWREGGAGEQWAIVRLGPSPRPAGFWARITGHSYGDRPWTYDFEEVEKTSAGYGGWTAVSDGRSGTAYNGVEEGDWVDQLEYYEEMADDSIVWMREVNTAGTIEYWFSDVTLVS